MTRSTEFGRTVRRGVRAGQADLVVHAIRESGSNNEADGPRIGLVINKSVGNAVQRHRVARRLRHVLKTYLPGLDPRDRIVVRALPGAGVAPSAEFDRQLKIALRRVGDLMDTRS